MITTVTFKNTDEVNQEKETTVEIFLLLDPENLIKLLYHSIIFSGKRKICLNCGDMIISAL